MRCLAKRPFAAVDEGRSHAECLGTNAIESVVGDKQDARSIKADDFLSLGVGLPVRLEVTGLLHRDHMIKWKADMWTGCLQHVAIAIRQYREFEPRCAQALQAGYHVGKWLQPLDFGNKRRHFRLCVADAATIEHVADRPMADLPVWRMAAIEKRINHRVFEVRAPPPRDKARRIAGPSLSLEKRRRGFGQAALHIDDRAVLIERQCLDFAFQNL